MSEWRPEFTTPAEIEARSFEIIAQEMGQRDFDEMTDLVVRRVIHTTADFDYAENLCFSPRAVERGVEALRQGAQVATDTTMVAAGINKRVLAELGGAVRTFIADADVAEEARRRGITRSAVSMEKAARLEGPLICAIGNAPTALVRLHELIRAQEMPMPELVIGVPVGFVNVVESKELIMTSAAHYIVACGRKGGSNVAAAIVNALLYMARA